MADSKALVKKGEAEGEDQYVIKPQNTVPSLNTSDWPLLLKNYDKMLVRSGHFTPIPNGSSPYKRDIKSYVSSGVINLVSAPGAEIGNGWRRGCGAAATIRPMLRRAVP